MSFVQPLDDDEYFYRNAQGDEIVFVSDGAGVLESPLGEPRVPAGATTSSSRAASCTATGSPSARPRCLVIESAGLRAHAAPLPQRARPADRERAVQRARHPAAGATCRRIDETRRLPDHRQEGQPPDARRRSTTTRSTSSGWDGYYYPWAFNINDFEPRVGRVHLPPPVHQTFEGDGFVVCSFCPRPYDFDPQAVPVPYVTPT